MPKSQGFIGKSQQKVRCVQRLLDRYILRQTAATATVVALTLAGVLLMTQSLRFLELIIDSGASGLAFITLSLLALPRFFEVILPIALAVGTMFVYLRLRKDGEITVMQASGMTPLAIARPGLYFSLGIMVLMFAIMAWFAPMTLAQMQKLRVMLKAQYSTLLFREGVFSSAGKDVTVYVANRGKDGALEGLMVYDARAVNPLPVTVIARQGQLLATDRGQQVVVFNGARQTYNPTSGSVERLNFERYTIDMPDAAPIRQRWSEPEERTLWQLFNPAPDDASAREQRRAFVLEIHRRIVSPLLAPSFFMVTIALLLFAPFGRARRGLEVLWCAAILVGLQALYLGAFTLANERTVGLVLMYVVVLGPLAAAGAVMWRGSRLPSPHTTPAVAEGA